jgi:hypothetical protein
LAQANFGSVNSLYPTTTASASMKVLFALFIQSAPVLSYKQLATCIPGSSVAGQEETKGLIGPYAQALQKTIPSYGDVNMIAEGPEDQCLAAANAVNTNVYPSKDQLRVSPSLEFEKAFPSPKLLVDHPDLTEIPLKTAFHEADSQKSYLYVFQNNDFVEHDVLADCVPGGVVGSLTQSMGMVGLYTIALQTILPNLLGDLKFLGKTKIAGACLALADRLNSGNATLSELKKEGAFKGDTDENVKEVKIFNVLSKGDANYTYLYVMQNKMWDDNNGTLSLLSKQDQKAYAQYEAAKTAWLKAHAPKKPKGGLGGLSGKIKSSETKPPTTTLPTTVATTAAARATAETATETTTEAATETTTTPGATQKKGGLAGLVGGLFGKKKSTETTTPPPPTLI